MDGQLALEPLHQHPQWEKVATLPGASDGQMTQVAQHRRTGDFALIKFLPRGFDEETTQRLIRSTINHMELSTALHPHIVTYRETFLTPHYLAMVTEYIEGETIETFLEKVGGRVIEGLARFVYQQLAIAIDYCHQRNKVLRHVKLCNVLLSICEGQLPLLKLCDFSVSKDLTRDLEAHTQDGSILYAAPEVLTNTANGFYDAKAADVWSVGVVVYVMLFGRHPFMRDQDGVLNQDQRMYAILQRTVKGDAETPQDIVHTLSAECLDILRRMLNPDPNQRITMQQVMAHPWFLEALPDGALAMNRLFLAEGRSLGANDVASVQAIVHCASALDSGKDSGLTTVPNLQQKGAVQPQQPQQQPVTQGAVQQGYAHAAGYGSTHGSSGSSSSTQLAAMAGLGSSPPAVSVPGLSPPVASGHPAHAIPPSANQTSHTSHTGRTMDRQSSGVSEAGRLPPPCVTTPLMPRQQLLPAQQQQQQGYQIQHLAAGLGATAVTSAGAGAVAPGADSQLSIPKTMDVDTLMDFPSSQLKAAALEDVLRQGYQLSRADSVSSPMAPRTLSELERGLMGSPSFVREFIQAGAGGALLGDPMGGPASPPVTVKASAVRAAATGSGMSRSVAAAAAAAAAIEAIRASGLEDGHGALDDEPAASSESVHIVDASPFLYYEGPTGGTGISAMSDPSLTMAHASFSAMCGSFDFQSFNKMFVGLSTPSASHLAPDSAWARICQDAGARVQLDAE